MLNASLYAHLALIHRARSQPSAWSPSVRDLQAQCAACTADAPPRHADNRSRTQLLRQWESIRWGSEDEASARRDLTGAEHNVILVRLLLRSGTALEPGGSTAACVLPPPRAENSAHGKHRDNSSDHQHYRRVAWHATVYTAQRRRSMLLRTSPCSTVFMFPAALFSDRDIHIVGTLSSSRHIEWTITAHPALKRK